MKKLLPEWNKIDRILLVLIIAVGLISTLVYFGTNNKGVPTSIVNRTEKNLSNPSSADGKYIKDYISSSQSEYGSFRTEVRVIISGTNCTNGDCTDTVLKDCRTGTYFLTYAGLETESKYEILGPTALGCSVKETSIKNPDPTWQNKSMVCSFDRNKSLFEAANQNFLDIITSKPKNDCSGELVQKLLTL